MSRQDTSEQQNAASVRSAARRLVDFSDQLDAAAAVMEKHGLEPLRVRFQASLLDGMKSLLRWKHAVDEAVQEELAKRGVFQVTAEEGTPSSKKRPAKKRSDPEKE